MFLERKVVSTMITKKQEMAKKEFFEDKKKR
jgi:hypothetical protein